MKRFGDREVEAWSIKGPDGESGKMSGKYDMIGYGPVPSRRLGRSLGINNIPPKICSYSCVYCQLGRTTNMSVKREAFVKPRELVEAVQIRVDKLQDNGERIDYLSFVPDGEPTLDINLGKEIEEIRRLGIKVAVITNASLLWQQEVRNDLLKADWVSLKIDAVSPQLWKKIDRPNGFLRLKWILEGIEEFSRIFDRKLVTETMLVQGLNCDDDELGKIADFITSLEVKTSYLSIPTRPPPDKWVKPANEEDLAAAYHIFDDRGIDVEYLTGFEGTEFACTGDVKKDLLSITAVHPMREDAVLEMLRKGGNNWDVVEELLENGNLVVVNYKQKKFFKRIFKEATKMNIPIASGKSGHGEGTPSENLTFPPSLESMRSVLDSVTRAELQVLENPKSSQYINKALEDKDFLAVILGNLSTDDWLLRWGITRILVHICKRKPELMKESIPYLVSRLPVEKKRMVRDNIRQSLVHLSKGIPDDFVGKGAVDPFLKLMGNGEDHEQFDAITVIKNIAQTDREVVKGQIITIKKIANEIDNPVVRGEAERALAFLKNSQS